jgi:2-dehydro-3-deoxy-D-pentonate aldolase
LVSVQSAGRWGWVAKSKWLIPDERRRFAKEVVRIIGGRVPLVIGVGAAGTKEMVELARHAEGAGADAVLVVSPFYWKVGEESLFRYFATVAESVGIPVVIYNLPMLTGIDLSPSLIARIASECPNVSGLKDTVTEYFHTVGVLREVKRVRSDFSVLAGWEDLILPSLLAGANGSICAFANVAPELFVELVHSAQIGDLDKAAGLHRRILLLLTLGTYSDSPIGAIKVAMNKLGVPISHRARTCPTRPGSGVREGRGCASRRRFAAGAGRHLARLSLDQLALVRTRFGSSS